MEPVKRAVVYVAAVCVCWCGIFVFHPSPWGSVLSGYSEGQRWHRGRGVSHHCHLSISPSLLSCILISLSFVARGMWTLLNFPLGGWVMETTGGEGWGESSPSLVLSSVFSCFIPSRGLWSWGLRGEKAAQAALLILGSVLYTLPWFHWGQRVKRVHRSLFFSVACLFKV